MLPPFPLAVVTGESVFLHDVDNSFEARAQCVGHREHIVSLDFTTNALFLCSTSRANVTKYRTLGVGGIGGGGGRQGSVWGGHGLHRGKRGGGIYSFLLSINLT